MASVFQPSAPLDIPGSDRRRSGLEGVDPRSRVVAVLLFSAVVAASGKLLTLGVALGLAAAATIGAGACTWSNLKRLIPVNAFVLLLFVLLPLGDAPAPLKTWGPFAQAGDGLRWALAIALKANAIVLSVEVLLAGLDGVVLGHALGQLGVPRKLTHLLLFTIRYLGVLQRESMRLRAAMKVRGFRPGVNWHTYRTIGNLVGMLLVRSLDRADRIVAAMKCRGFCGRFYLLDHFAFSARDVAFSAVVLLAVSLIAFLEWL